MNLNKTIEFIINDLRETRDIIDDLKNYPGVPLLQVELAKSKCKSAEELIGLLKQYEETETRVSTTTAINDPSSNKDVTVEELIEFEMFEEINEQAGDPIQPNGNSHQGKAILADMFRNNSENINEKIGNIKGDGDINSMLKGKPISNLVDAIGINDKFYYIREIFSGNHVSYEDAIKKLNSVEKIDDARAVIMSYTNENNDNEAVSQLMELVKRKLLTNV